MDAPDPRKTRAWRIFRLVILIFIAFDIGAIVYSMARQAPRPQSAPPAAAASPGNVTPAQGAGR